MRWLPIVDLSELAIIKELSKEQHIRAVLVFKHSTRCSISNMALHRLEDKWVDRDDVPCYFLNLLEHRDISNQLAADFHVEHQSPQVLLIKDAQCFYHESHSGISVRDITDVLTR